MKQIIAAIDFSPVSDEVVDRAAQIARAFSARLTLLHIAAPEPDFIGYDPGPETVRESRAGELRFEHRELQQRGKKLRDRGVDAEGLLIQGPTVETIIEKARDIEADLIVLGSHGHGAVYRVLMGSISEGVVRAATVPILVIPAQTSKS